MAKTYRGSMQLRKTCNYFQRWFNRQFVVDRTSISSVSMGNGEVSVTYKFSFWGQRIGATTSGFGEYFIRLRRNGDHLEIVGIRDDYKPSR